MKIEIGGGVRPRGDGFINVDLTPNADIRFDLNQRPWTFVDANSVEELYSSHCFEHLEGMNDILYEVARICRTGAKVEFRMPHPNSHLAMVWDHAHVFSPIAARNIEEHFPHDIWKDRGPRRLKFERHEYRACVLLEEAKRDLPFLRGLTDEVIMRYIPGTCHEVAYHCTVVENEFA